MSPLIYPAILLLGLLITVLKISYLPRKWSRAKKLTWLLASVSGTQDRIAAVGIMMVIIGTFLTLAALAGLR